MPEKELSKIEKKLLAGGVPEGDLDITHRVIGTVFTYTNLYGKPSQNSVRELIIEHNIIVSRGHKFNHEALIRGINNAAEKGYICPVIFKEREAGYTITEKGCNLFKD